MRLAFDLRMATWGGVGTYSVELLRALLRLHPADGLHVLAFRGESDSHLEAMEGLEGVEWRVLRGDPWSPRGSLEAGLAARGRVDLYHAPHVTVPIGFDGPLVTTIHDLIPLLAPDCMPDPLHRAVFRAAATQAVRRSAVILTVSRFTARTLYDKGLAPRAIVVTPNGIGPRFAPQPTETVEAVRTALGLPRDYVLWVGAFKPHKNVLTLLRAWATLPAPLRRRHPLVLAGDAETPYGATVQGEAERLTVERDEVPPVAFTGRVETGRLPGLYCGAAAFVFPSLIEGFGLPPLEAAACGTAVLAGATPPVPDLLREGAAYFDPTDPGELATLLARILEDPERRERLSRRGQARAKRFTWERTATETLKAYRTALTGTPPSA